MAVPCNVMTVSNATVSLLNASTSLDEVVKPSSIQDDNNVQATIIAVANHKVILE